MLVSEKILREWVETKLSADELAETLTMGGIEVEEVISEDKWLKNVLVGKVLKVEAHPNADKLRICKVLVDEELQIICGAPNVVEGSYVACAKVGALLPKNFKIKSSKIRGVISNGMLCSEKELGLSDDGDGIIILESNVADKLGVQISEVLNKSDKIFNIKPTPNRADCFSVRGIARDLSAMSESVTFKYPENLKFENMAKNKVGRHTHNIIGVCSDVCHAFASIVITGVNNQGSSPDWLVNKLNKFGQKTISPLVDISNYFMFLLGRPSHIFDLDKIDKKEQILEIREGYTSEKLLLLNGDEVENLANTIVIADSSGPVALAGLMGGSSTMVTADTTNILVESAVWLPAMIRGKARRFSLVSEAASRFEKGVDPETLEADFQIICNLILEITGGTLGNVYFENFFDKSEKKVTFSKKRCNDTLGINVTNEEFERIFKNLNFKISNNGSHMSDTFDILVPFYRYDLEIEEDLIEEVARIHGYNNIPAIIPTGIIEPGLRNTAMMNTERIRDYLTAVSFFEIIGFGFIEKKLAERFLFQHNTKANTVNVLNPISVHNSTMRTSQIPGMLKILAENHRNQREKINLFEIGNIFISSSTEMSESNQSIVQHKILSFIGSGPRYQQQWGLSNDVLDFYDIKMIIEELSPITITIEKIKQENDILHPGRSGMVVPKPTSKKTKIRGLDFFNGEAVGYIGELHPQLCSDLSLPSPTIVCEVGMEFLNQERTSNITEIVRFPSVRRDLAFLIDKNCPISTILKAITSNLQQTKGCSIVKNVTPFDVYVGEDLPEGKKSITFSVVLQDPCKTLEESELEVACSGVVKLAEAVEGVSIRR
ncbi:phenylalanine--tRNA ligase subunit beta [Betaproteobacteria bacterium]|nr:phenylalanine--tRNA ligase subunit beta [Betaproteobacteria bacterium]